MITEIWCNDTDWITGTKNHPSQTLSTINPTCFDLHSRWMARPSYYDGLTADTAVRPVCQSVCHPTLSVHNVGCAHIAVLQLPQERPHIAQGEDGLQPDVRAPASVYWTKLQMAQTIQRRSLLSERHRLSQHTSQYKQTKFSLRYIYTYRVGSHFAELMTNYYYYYYYFESLLYH
jgi:hypothetical protein